MQPTSSSSSRTRFCGHFAAILALMAGPLTGLGCGGHPAYATTEQPPPQAAVAQPSPDPVAVAPKSNLPPPPVPATFDVAALADQVKPMVVNITSTHEITRTGFEGLDPFGMFPGFGGPRGRMPD